ncbi:hypothetical protein GCM10010394_22120 [Streptomyces crystallinus]|uniref:Uncharacterized protein n=1 Tax=Streptomyces crystallinus TaxID=68191 RepID=A0ABP3QQY1_9ACTN
MTRDRELAAATGTSSGIGSELARPLAERGLDLLVTSAEEEHRSCAAGEIGRLTRADVQPVRTAPRTYEEAESFVGGVAATGRPAYVAIAVAVHIPGQIVNATGRTPLP